MDEVEELKELKRNIRLLNIEEVSYITNWSKATILKIMEIDKDFPVIKIGKENQVLKDALKEYLSIRRDLRG